MPIFFFGIILIDEFHQYCLTLGMQKISLTEVEDIFLLPMPRNSGNREYGSVRIVLSFQIADYDSNNHENL